MFNIPNNVKPSLSLNPVDNTGNTQNNHQNMQQPYNNGQYSGQQSSGSGMNTNSFNNNNFNNNTNNNFNNNFNNNQNLNSNQNFSNGVVNNAGPAGVILAKGQKVSLSKFNSALDMIDVGLGWDVSTQNYDLDSSAFMLGSNDKVIGDDWFVFYNQTCSPDGSVRHSGDNTTGEGAGDDEVISIKLSQVNPSVSKIVFVVTINEAKQRNLNFSGVSNAYIRVVDRNMNRELVRFNLTDYYSNVTSMMVGEIYKKNNEWRFNPIGNGTDDDLFGLCRRYGVNVAG